ncbi:MAG: rhomboid family intramembrane serine protease [Bacilli bacterium]|nr:rhomboid family intramembrane serine protease [Bacilli bacterium]
MAEITTKEDELVMKLLHYFITEENYTPIVLHGANNEIWLENFDNDYTIVRIVSNYIHNNEQFELDMYKTRQIMKSISKKTISPTINTLSLFINLGDNVNYHDLELDNNILCADIKELKDLKKFDFITEQFPDIISKTKFKEEGLDLFAKITGDITIKTEKKAKEAEDIFKPKKPYITYTLIIINVIMYLIGVAINLKYGLSIYDAIFETTEGVLNLLGGLENSLVKGGQYFRILTAAFNHIGLMHLVFNIYALYIVGSQLESFLGKTKYALVYLFSAITGNLLSIAFYNGWSAGASGAIMGLLGALVYFGYHYRVFLGQVVRSQIMPLILINLLIGFISSRINNAAHIGGLIGGFFILMALGVKSKSTKSDKINGIVLATIFLIFLIYISFFRA